MFQLLFGTHTSTHLQREERRNALETRPLRAPPQGFLPSPSLMNKRLPLSSLLLPTKNPILLLPPHARKQARAILQFSAWQPHPPPSPWALLITLLPNQTTTKIGRIQQQPRDWIWLDPLPFLLLAPWCPYSSSSASYDNQRSQRSTCIMSSQKQLHGRTFFLDRWFQTFPPSFTATTRRKRTPFIPNFLGVDGPHAANDPRARREQ